MSSGDDRRFVFGSATSPQSSGFGGFGSSTPSRGLQLIQAPVLGSGFSTTSSSLFGNVGGSTGGSTRTAAGVFGSPSTSGFGTSSSGGFGTPLTRGFGAPSASGFGTPSTSGFGTSGTFGTYNGFGFGRTLRTPTIPLSNGTATPPFSPTVLRDDVGSNCRYQSINFMPPYTNFSFEELRLADYNAGRRFGTPITSFGGFGSSLSGGFGTGVGTGFGTPATTTSSTPPFGMTSAISTGFSSKPGLFGTVQSNTSPFGSTTFSSSASPFKGVTSVATASGQGLFGTTAPTTTSAFGSVGSQQQAFQPFGSRMGGFGTTTAQVQPFVSTFGGTSTGGTVGPSQFPANSSSSLFGKPAFEGIQGAGGPFGGGIFGGVGSSATGLAPVRTAPSYPQQPSGGFFGTSQWNVPGASAPSAPGPFSPFGAQSTVQQPFGATQLFGSPVGTWQTSQPAVQSQPELKVSSLTDSNPYGQSSLWTGLHLKPSDSSFTPLFTPIAATQRMKESQLKQSGTKPPAKAFYMAPTRRAYLGTRPRDKAVGTKTARHHFVADGDIVLRPDAFESSQRRWSSGDLQHLTIDPNIRQDLFRRQSLSPEPLSRMKGTAVSVSPDTDSEREGLLAEQKTQPNEIESKGDLTKQRSYDPKSENKSDTATRSDTLSALDTQEKVDQIPETGEKLPDTVAEGGAAGQLAGEKATSALRPGLHTGEYWMKPTRDELGKMTADKLQRLTGFVVGRKGCGQVTFDHPVDLTALPMDNIYDEIVQIRPRSITVYPNESFKPPPGQGLNVPATLCIENSWPRTEGKPSAAVTSGPHVETHINRLKAMKGTQFISYEPPTGTWTFKVPHFSVYYDPDFVEEN